MAATALTRLADLAGVPDKALVSFVGVVHGVGEAKQCRGARKDWALHVFVADASLPAHSDVLVAFFRASRSALPQLCCGEVALFTDYRVQKHNENWQCLSTSSSRVRSYGYSLDGWFDVEKKEKAADDIAAALQCAKDAFINAVLESRLHSRYVRPFASASVGDYLDAVAEVVGGPCGSNPAEYTLADGSMPAWFLVKFWDGAADTARSALAPGGVVLIKSLLKDSPVSAVARESANVRIAALAPHNIYCEAVRLRIAAASSKSRDTAGTAVSLPPEAQPNNTALATEAPATKPAVDPKTRAERIALLSKRAISRLHNLGAHEAASDADNTIDVQINNASIQGDLCAAAQCGDENTPKDVAQSVLLELALNDAHTNCVAAVNTQSTPKAQETTAQSLESAISSCSAAPDVALDIPDASLDNIQALCLPNGSIFETPKTSESLPNFIVNCNTVGFASRAVISAPVLSISDALSNPLPLFVVHATLASFDLPDNILGNKSDITDISDTDAALTQLQCVLFLRDSSCDQDMRVHVAHSDIYCLSSGAASDGDDMSRANIANQLTSVLESLTQTSGTYGIWARRSHLHSKWLFQLTATVAERVSHEIV